MERNFLKLVKDFEFEKEEKAFTPTGREKTIVVKQKFDYANIDREVYKQFVEYCRKYNASPKDVIKIILYEEMRGQSFFKFFNRYLSDAEYVRPQNELTELRKDEILTLVGIAFKKCSAVYNKNKLEFYSLIDYVLTESAFNFYNFDNTIANIHTYFTSQVNYRVRDFLNDENKTKLYKETYEQDGTYEFYSMNYANIDDIKKDFGGQFPSFVEEDLRERKKIIHITSKIDEEGREVSIYDIIKPEMLINNNCSLDMLVLYLHHCIETLYEKHQIPIKMVQLNWLSRVKNYTYEDLADIYQMSKSNVGKIITKMLDLLKDCIKKHIEEIYELPKDYTPKADY